MLFRPFNRLPRTIQGRSHPALNTQIKRQRLVSYHPLPTRFALHVHARISAEGKLYTCLFATKGTDLRDLIRNEEDDEIVLKQISHVWENRIDRYSDERNEQTMKERKKHKIEMSHIGG